jgi:FK506-binding protein 4/5
VGVETMKKGEICTLICKPEYAYGKPGKPPTIPQNSTLVFEIELLYWEDEKVTDDSLVSKKILKKGKGNDCVSDGGTVEGLQYVALLSLII